MKKFAEEVYKGEMAWFADVAEGQGNEGEEGQQQNQMLRMTVVTSTVRVRTPGLPPIQ